MGHQPTEARRVAARSLWPWRRSEDGQRPRWVAWVLRALAAHPEARRAPTATSAYGVFAVLLLFPTTLKVVKARGMTEGAAGLLDLVTVAAPDVGLALLSLSVTVILARFLRPLRGGFYFFAALTSLYLLLVLMLSALEHQSWVRSASLLDWKIFWYTIEHYSELKVVIAAETTTAGVLLLGGAAVLSLAPVLVDVTAARQLALGPALKWRAALIALALAIPCALAASAEPESPELHPLTQAASVGLLAGAFDAAGGEEKRTEFRAPDAERAKQRIEEALAAANIRLAEGAPKPKNVLMLIMESTRYDATSAYVSRLRTTPQLAKLAQGGLMVDTAYVDVPHTSKALVSILCGYSPRFSVQITEAEPGGLPTPCIAHVLGQLGYRRSFFQAATGTYENRHQLATNAGYEEIYTRESYDESGFEETNYLSMEDKIMVDPVMKWVDGVGDEPFFISILTCTTHHSYGTPTNFKLRAYPRRPARTGGRMPRPWSDYNSYLNAVRYSDEFLEELIEGLRKRGKLDDTLIVVVGDHGQAFYEHGQKAHNTVIWNEGLRVPLVFYNEHLIPEPLEVEGVRRQVDIAPTMLSMLGVEHEGELFEGKDLVSSEGHEAVYSNCWYDGRCAAETRGNIRVIDHFDNQPMEVYDLEADPFERRNLLRAGSQESRDAWKVKAEQARERIRARPTEIEERYAAGAAGDQPFLLSEAPDPQYEVRARFDEHLELIGYDAATHTVTPDGFWELNVYFKCLKESEEGWRIFGRLQTVDGRTMQVDHHPGNGRFYLQNCKPGTIIADHVRVWIPGDFPPGKVRYWWGSVLLKGKGHVRRTNKRLQYRKARALQRGVLVKGKALMLAELEVTPDYRPQLAKLLKTSVLREAPKIDNPLDVRFEEGLVLLKAEVAPTETRRLSSTTLTTVWKVEKQLEGPWKMLVHLDSVRRGYWFRRSHTPVGGVHPIANWEPGTWIVDTHILPIAKHMPRDKATVWVGVRNNRKRMKVIDAGKGEILDRRVKVDDIEIKR